MELAMKRSYATFLIGTVLAIGGSLLAQPSAPEMAFDVVDVLKTPNDIHVGEIGGVGANSKGQIFVYTRTGHP
jgi:hypothetical protein